MASIGQIIFWSMIFLIIVISGIIIFILAIAFSVSQGTVQSSKPYNVGNLGQDVVLDCKFLTNSGSGTFSDVSISWIKDGLSGVVYQYKNRVAQLQNQNTQFKNRAQLFPDAISTGNASLLLRNVKLEDDGVYRCSVSASKISGNTKVNLKVAAYSEPTFKKQKNGSLTAEAQRWFPQPKVAWFNQSGQILKSSSWFINTSAGIMQVSSVLEVLPKTNNIYTCVMQNDLVKAVSEANVTEKEVTGRTYFSFNAASTNVLSLHLLAVILFHFILQ